MAFLCLSKTNKNHRQPAVAASVKAAVDRLSNLGAKVVEVSIPYLDQHCASYYVNVLSEASANLARYDGTR
jgi:aspartyl-tRNA(Asn)/glutamyl-tRNA(Gln) amidotransferase subunit A